MADLIRPNYGSAWATTGEKVAPDAGKFALGWVQEMMPYQYENYLQARQDDAILYLLQKGIAEYSPTQEYIANKSLVLYNSAVYIATQTVTGVLPTVSTSWKRVSTISDNLGIVSVSGGGTGATTAIQARNNLGLGTAATLDSSFVVQKDVNGDFTANVITASLAGNASTSDRWKTARTIQLIGGASSAAASVDGSSNVSISVTSLDATTLTGTVPTNSLVNAVVKTSPTGVAKLPKGTTAQRPSSGTEEFGDFRANETTGLLEYWNGAAWVSPSQYAADLVVLKAGSVMTGDLTVPSLNGGQLAGMRNKLINGNFSVNQRAVSGTVTLAAGAYGHDGWKAGAGGCTYTFSTSQNVTTITITAGSLQQVIDGNDLQSGVHVLSWVGTAQGRVGGGSYGTSGAVTASVTGGVNTTIEFNVGTITFAQFESGTKATPFEHRFYAVEKSLCQTRLYPLYRPGVSTDTIGYGGMFRPSVGQVLISGTRLRATPTIIGVPLVLVGATTGSTAITTVELLASGDVFLLTAAGSYTAQPAFLAKNASNTLPTFLSAEL